ncbi:MAG: IS1595 family transposase [Deltaproteobacteria bacterium]|nr:IS1595 family transposase [Deltaproteobacteria bacterium]
MEQLVVPRTLQEAVVYFANPDRALAFMVQLRWPNGVVCQLCGSRDAKFIPTRRLWECPNKHAKRQFSIKKNTIMEDSPIPLEKWLPAIWMISNCKNGISSYELHRALKVTQKTAWFMLHRIRLAMQNAEGGGMMWGTVEVDETYVGGKARNMHADHKAKKIKGRGTAGKAAVLGLLQRHGKGKSKVRATVIHTPQRERLQGEIRKHVEEGSNVFTDEHAGYVGIAPAYEHRVINHAETYVRGMVHTNGIENFWSLLKRGIRGTYVSVEPFHLFRYVDEQVFRFNERKNEDGDGGRFLRVVSSVFGERLMYKNLIAKAATT